MISIDAYAKINLSLDITGRRPNGYHEVKMVMQSIDLFDTLTFEIIKGESKIILTEESAMDLGPLEKNLVYRAAKLMLEEANIKDGVGISLLKRIPVAAGMAGGSTDAAATFHGLNKLFDIGFTEKKLCELGVKLGADIPFCIMGGTALSEGIGEILTKLSAPPQCHLLIAKPNINVSTKYVYEEYDKLKDDEINHPDVDGMLLAIKNKDIELMADMTGNVLEFVTAAKYKEIDIFKSIMSETGALSSMMSGSGPTVFGIYENTSDGLKKAEMAADIIKEKYNDAAVFVTGFIS